MMRFRRAFTLIELLTVMAISAILLGLIVLPLFQSFNLTRAAQAFAEAQDRARILTDRIAREIGNSALVRGGSGLVTVTVNSKTQQVQPNSLVFFLPNPTGTAVRGAIVPYTKLDLLRPAEGDQSEVGSPSAGFTDPGTGLKDPTLNAPKGQVVLPVAPGYSMIRYFVGRRDPFKEYNNPYDGILMARNGSRDNLYVLFRAEVQPYVYRNNKNTPNDDTTKAWRPNLSFFQSDDATDRQITDLDNPLFFEPTRDASYNIVDDRTSAGQTQGKRVQNWLAKSVIQTEVSRYDMILPVYNKATHVAEYDLSTGAPRLIPLIQFRPERMNNDPATGSVAVRQGEESDASVYAGADTFSTQYGLWSNAIIRTYPVGWSYAGASPSNRYEVGLVPDDNSKSGLSVYAYLPESGPNDYVTSALVELFDVDQYQQLATVKGINAGDKVYPFSVALQAANNRSNWLNDANLRALFTPYDYDSKRGRVRTSFDISEVGTPSATPTDPLNLPIWPTSETAPYTPDHDPDLTGNFYDAKFRSVNEKFNKVWHDYPALQPDRVQRYLDLRVVPNSDGTPSPLYPKYISGTPTGFLMPARKRDGSTNGGTRSRVQIVPGSEVIIGPDQILGPHYGLPIRYTRVTRGEPGPNQYKINYTDLQEPVDDSNNVTAAAYAAAFGLPVDAGFNPAVYDATNFFSAVLQPRFKVGYIQFNSDPNAALPFNATTTTPNTDPNWVAEQGFRVSYRFQFTGSDPNVPSGANRSDSFAVDYDTRQLLSVLLTIRNYPQSNVPNPQTVTLKSTATVRNYTR